MNRTKKMIALGLCASMVFSFFGCGKNTPAPEATTAPAQLDTAGVDKVDFSIPYIRTSSLNPFKTDVEPNLNIATLLYDSLFSVDNSFKAAPLIAESYTKNGLKINVKLRAVKFTDGTDVTAEDVVYSFVQAKNSVNYSAYLDNLSDCSKVNASEVVFTLKNGNPYEEANIFFPIIKKGTDGTDDNSKDKVPVGSGRYTIKEEKGEKYLYYNKDRLGGYSPKYLRIGLRDSSDTSSINTLFAAGNIDMHCESFSEGFSVSYKGTPADKEMTLFTFLGINSEKTVFSDPRVRRAMALLLDCDDIASVSFKGLASGSSVPFSPYFYGIKNAAVPPVKQDKDAAIALLNEAGFSELNADSVRYKGDDVLSLNLIINRENTFRRAVAENIKAAFAQANILVTINTYPYNDYIARIKKGYYDIYVGEVRLTNSFDLTHFFDGAQDISVGINPDCATAKKYKAFEDGSATMQELLDTYADDLPFISIAFRHGLAIRSDTIKTEIKPTVSDYFYNVDEWTIG